MAANDVSTVAEVDEMHTNDQRNQKGLNTEPEWFARLTRTWVGKLAGWFLSMLVFLVIIILAWQSMRSELTRTSLIIDSLNLMTVVPAVDERSRNNMKDARELRDRNAAQDVLIGKVITLTETINTRLSNIETALSKR